MSPFEKAMAAIDAANGQDPNVEIITGQARAKELVYSERMTRWLDRLVPAASEELRLAVRAQHIRRWTRPRNAYSAGRDGYKAWRADLGRFHADTAGEILIDAGYDDSKTARVKALIRKEKFKIDTEAQALEDVACLVFLEDYFDDFARKHEEDKLIDIVRKTWIKMSEQGHEAALTIPLSPEAKVIVGKALTQEQ